MVLEKLEEEIAEAQLCATDPPKNESNTCEWIILPLLWAAGYARRDIESRMADSTGQFPDYTLLPNHSAATYYLEAKAWNVPLDTHTRQALSYTNNNGKRFIVLTNGQDWRLYDNTIQGMLGEKLVKQATLQDNPQITEFLTMLSKLEVLNGSLERVATETHQRKLQKAQELQEQEQHEEEIQSIQIRQMEIRGLLNILLPDLLNDSKGELIALMADHLSDQEEFKGIVPETLSAWFTDNFYKLLADQAEQRVPPAHVPLPSPSFSKQLGESTWTLKEIQSRSIDGKKSRPVTLQTPDGTSVSATSWVQLAVQVVGWLLRQPHTMPIPFISSHQTRYFLNRTPQHKRQDQRTKFKEISAPGEIIYMDADRSGEMFLKDLYALCVRMQVDPDSFQITMLL